MRLRSDRSVTVRRPSRCWRFWRRPPFIAERKQMSRVMLNPQRLFDRLWRARHPLRPRRSRWHTAAIVLLLLFFVGVIGGYNYLTNSERVRGMARDYLSGLLG